MKTFLIPKIIAPVLSFIILMMVIVFFWFQHNPPQFVNIFAATRPGVLQFEIPQRIVVNTPFKVVVKVDSNKQNVNAVGLNLRFDPRHLELISFDTSSSFCQFYPEKKYDNSSGRISISCGSPHPGFSGTADIIVLQFLPRLVTNTNLNIDPTSKILMSDGEGTNILEDFTPVKLSILNSL